MGKFNSIVHGYKDMFQKNANRILRTCMGVLLDDKTVNPQISLK